MTTIEMDHHMVYFKLDHDKSETLNADIGERSKGTTDRIGAAG